MRDFALVHKRPMLARRYGTATRISFPSARIEAQRAEIRHILHGPRVQPKLTVGAPDDAYEREADRVADHVMRMPAPDVPEETPVLRHEEDTAIQRLCAECEDEIRRQPVEEEELEEELVQPKALPGGTPEVTPDVQSRIAALRGGGRPLSKSERAFFEPRFGHDFSQVCVHAAAQAAEAVRAVNARAFTLGRDIAFGTGQYAPATETGRRLLAHELTHVVQQRNGSLVQRQTIAGPLTLVANIEEQLKLTFKDTDEDDPRLWKRIKKLEEYFNLLNASEAHVFLDRLINREKGDIIPVRFQKLHRYSRAKLVLILFSKLERADATNLYIDLQTEKRLQKRFRRLVPLSLSRMREKMHETLFKKLSPQVLPEEEVTEETPPTPTSTPVGPIKGIEVVPENRTAVIGGILPL